MFFGTDERLTEVSLPGELRQIINKNRAVALPLPHPNLAQLIASFTPRNFYTEEDARVAEILRQQRSLQDEQPSPLTRNVSRTDHLDVYLSHKKLKEEIKFLFDILRHGYGGYHYFGGDAVFLPVRDAILQQLAGMDNPLQVYSYLHLIIPHLRRVINDNHFQVHDITFRPPRRGLFMNEEFILRRYENSLITEIDERTYRVLSFNNILPTLTREGEFAWSFGMVTTAGTQETKEITIHLENTATYERYFRTIDLSIIESPFFENTNQFLLTREADGITILENRNLNVPMHQTNTFFQSGYALRDKPVLIMDLRGNGGGFTPPAFQWIRGYTGQMPNDDLAFRDVIRLTLTARELQRPSGPIIRPPGPPPNDNIRTLFRKIFNDPSLFEIREDGTRVLRRIPESIAVYFREAGLGFMIDDFVDNGSASRQFPIPNENIVIVLIDNNVASAGEIFAGYLRQLENILFVGTNTRGSLLTGDISRTILPFSSIDIIFGTMLTLRPDLSQFEGVGFMPDLWVPPGESLERVLRFIERYGLARQPDLTCQTKNRTDDLKC